MDRSVQPRVAYPYLFQTKITRHPQKKRVKLQPLPEFWYQTRIKTDPLPNCWAQNSTFPRTEIVKNIPFRAAHLQYTKYSQSPPRTTLSCASFCQ